MGLKGKHIDFCDETIRDGGQSLWGMRMPYGAIDVVAEELDQSGFGSISGPIWSGCLQMAVRAGEDPWEMVRLLKRKVKKTKITAINFVNGVSLGKAADKPAVWKGFIRKLAEVSGQRRAMFLSNTVDECKLFPTWFPFLREIGLESCPAICYYPSPRTDDKYFIDLTKKVLKFKPDMILLKDAGGLLTVERLKGILPTMIEDAHAQGIPVGIHTHGVSCNAGQVIVEAMKLGVDEVATCTPPLANGSSHTSIFAAVHNAEVLGLTHNINLEPLRVVEERLTAIAKQENLPIGVPLEYDQGVYVHQVPGGVMGSLKNQLGIIGKGDKLEEVLEEVPRVLEDMGYPIMITPFSQFVVTQATINVITGERYKEVMDPLIEMALGVWGVEDSGYSWMDQNLKDKLLSDPAAKRISEGFKMSQEWAESTDSLSDIKAQYNMADVSDEDFFLHYIMKGDAEIKKMRAAGPPKSYKKLLNIK